MTISRDLANIVPIINTTSTSATIKGTTGANMNLTIDTATAGNGGPYITLKEATSQKALIGTSGAILGNTTDDLAFIADTVGGGIRFFTNASATERMRLDSSGQLLVGVTATANGGVIQVSNGITFPASQNPCSNANTLDDYEEGTWTPANGVTTITVTSGTYTKIGRLVCIEFDFSLATNASTSAVTITGLPFTVSASTNFFGTMMSDNFNILNAFPYAQAGSTSMLFQFGSTTGGGRDSVAYSRIVSGGVVRGTLFYFT